VPRSSLGVLKHRSFRLYWIGQLISLVGLWMQGMAQSQVVASMTDSKKAIALIQVATSVPMVLLSARGGVIADRYDRRKILIATQIGLAAIAFLFGALVGTHVLRLWMVYVVAVLLGIVSAFDFPAQQALVPDLVPREGIADAVAMNSAIFHGARLIGPALAGVVIAKTSVFMTFAANGASYFAVVASLLMITIAAREPGAKRGGGDFREGVDFIRSNRTVKALLGFTGLTTMFIFPLLMVFLSIFMREVVHTTDEHVLNKAIAPVMSASGAGSLVAALSMMVIPARARGTVIFFACIAVSALLMAFTFQHDVRVCTAVMACMAFGISISIGLSSQILQVIVPTALRGRVMAVFGMLWTGLVPIAAIVSGPIADVIGLRPTLRGMAIGYAALALPWLLRAGVFGLGAPAPAPQTA
jgi:MFS family permease